MFDELRFHPLVLVFAPWRGRLLLVFLELTELQVIEHPVHHDAGDGDVDPERQGPYGNAPVQVESLLQGAIERGENQWHNDDGQNRV